MRFLVHPCRELRGEVVPGGYKHSILPIISASLLADGPVTLTGTPQISDVRAMCDAIEHLGGRARIEGDHLTIDPTGIRGSQVPENIAGQLRGIYLFMPSLLARTGSFAIPSPGGDRIGDRTLEFGLALLGKMGAETRNGPLMTGQAERLKGTVVRLRDTNDGPSITKISLIAGCLAQGVTIVHNPFRSPEIIDLADFLNSIGADISGMGTDTIVIVGQKRLRGGSYKVMADPLEAGTFMAACGVTGGEVKVHGTSVSHMVTDVEILRRMGLEITEGEGFVACRGAARAKATDFASGPFPGLNTDAAPLYVTLACLADGITRYEETVWESRWNYAMELRRMGASIEIEGNKLTMTGVKRLQAAKVRAADLRAAAALTLAGLAGDEVSEVSDAQLVYRGYERFDEKLVALGARIEKVDEQ